MRIDSIRFLMFDRSLRVRLIARLCVCARAQTNTWINVLLASYRYVLVCHKQHSTRITPSVARTSVALAVALSSCMYVPYFLSMGACRKPTRAQFDALLLGAGFNASVAAHFSEQKYGYFFIDEVPVCMDGALLTEPELNTSLIHVRDYSIW